MIHKVTSAIPNFLGQPDSYYHDRGTGRKYRRIHAGMQWPGSSPGAVVVLGEDLEKDAVLDEHPIWLLAEYENRNPSDIVARCQELKGLMQVESLFGDNSNRPMMALMRSGKANFSLSKAPLIDDPNAHETYLAIIREKSSATHKVLNFGRNSVLPAKLASLNCIPTGHSLETDFPHIAAFGYALASLVLFPYETPISHGGITYSPSDPGVGM